MVNSKKMSKSTVAIVILSLLLCLSLILTATGAWFTASKDGRENDVEGTFGTVTVDLTDAEQGSWSTLPKTTGNEYVVPGSTFDLAGATVKNTGNVSVYVVASITNLTVTLDKGLETQKVLGEEEITKLLGSARFTAVSDTLTAVDGYKDMYLLASNETLVVKGITLKVDEGTTNGNAANDAAISFDGAKAVIPNGTTINIEYQISVKAIQADYIQVSDAATALSATPND